MIRKLLLGVLLFSPLGFYPLLRDNKPLETIPPAPARNPLQEDTQVALHTFTLLPGQAFPGCLPWEALRRIGEDQTREIDELVKKDPVKLLERGLERYKSEVKGYRCTFAKQERVKDTLREYEV